VIRGNLAYLPRMVQVSWIFRSYQPTGLEIETYTHAALTITKGHEVGTTWTIGGDLGLGVGSVLGVDAGLSGSVSETITDSTAEGVDYPCPEGKWSCSILVYPGMKLVKGHLEEMVGNDAGCAVNPTDYEGNYEFKIPLKSQAGNPKASVQVCTCGNLEGAGDEGHPELLCAEDCVKPSGK
jgi:hypothetical protein